MYPSTLLFSIKCVCKKTHLNFRQRVIFAWSCHAVMCVRVHKRQGSLILDDDLFAIRRRCFFHRTHYLSVFHWEYVNHKKPTLRDVYGLWSKKMKVKAARKLKCVLSGILKASVNGDEEMEIEGGWRVIWGQQLRKSEHLVLHLAADRSLDLMYFSVVLLLQWKEPRVWAAVASVTGLIQARTLSGDTKRMWSIAANEAGAKKVRAAQDSWALVNGCELVKALFAVITFDFSTLMSNQK